MNISLCRVKFLAGVMEQWSNRTMLLYWPTNHFSLITNHCL
jgi:hypothetical protein